MKYNYQARTKEGRIETGTVEASSKDAAASLLQKYNIYVTSLKEIKSPFSIRIKFFEKTSKKDLAIFSRQMAVMLGSRVSVIQGLTSLAVQIRKKDFREKILKISQMVEEGSPLSEAFGAYPDIFSVFYVNLIKSGEASGKIAEVFYYLSDHLEREADIESQLKSAMIYPLLVLFVFLIVLFIVMIFIMPKLVDLLREATAEPPLSTLLIINFYEFLKGYGWILIVAFFFLIGFLIYYFRTKEGRKKFDEISLKIPFIKIIIQKIFLIRFSESVSTLVSAGLSINKALQITGGTVTNVVYKKITSEVEEGVSEGEKISSILIKHPEHVPVFVVQMIKVGEETGQLDKTLMEIVNFYQKEVKRAVDTFTALLEPILIIFLGIVVSLLAISVLAPLYGSLGTI
ncbi:MAG: type II secretion system F family protein [Candidatus Staskawiczbacteria bacterium]|nr:type II secretion system F family protein [Candidatus Staskawiczbacteria bacterium]MBI3337170.1 type II secretion system F family protein [Candidatus Staskawiczbacteria bacterium]